MKATVINPRELSVGDMLEHASALYFLHVSDELGKPVLTPIGTGSLGILNEDSLLMRITHADSDISPEPKEVEKVTHRRKQLTYKFNGQNSNGVIRVDFRPENGGIRVSFPDKESAQSYFEYFREQFYTSTTGASVITVSNIYKDLGLVNWNPEDCDDWGWWNMSSYFWLRD